jgi:hypothetical protein
MFSLLDHTLYNARIWFTTSVGWNSSHQHTRHMHGSMQCSITARQIILHMSPLQASADSSPEVAACCHQRPRFHFVRARAIGHNLPCTIDVHCSSSSTSLTWTKKCGRTSLLVMVCIAHRHFSTCVEEHWKLILSRQVVVVVW